ncbi:hypothetical protein J3459_010813 [Metarhizium acridum]|uniref:uncharacterized protein n=1 Tax=Metarhizium acridum TaxID=92637 RepID=UPI001C6CE408|nr:hypothetical protein J3458_019854 [Metarhizium acridum]KAG8421974.1 hypothetical protein J3459_010813 [Metarhizium acridum]
MKRKFKAFQKNVKFNKNTFQNQRGAGVAPQPAGFPRLSTAWQEDPWRHFKAQDVQKNLDDLIASVCAGKHSCMTQLGHSSKQKSAKTPWTSNGADRPTRWEAGEAKAKSSQERLPGVRKSGDAGGLLAPYLQDVLRRLRSWDHPTGQTRVFWALQSVTPGQERPADLGLLSYGEKNKRRLDSVNDVLGTCERVEQQLGAKVKHTCAHLRKRAMEIEAPAAAKLVPGQAACLACGFAWDAEGGKCRNRSGVLIRPLRP